MTNNIFSSIDSLRGAGFDGFVSISELRRSRLKDVPCAKGEVGVYIVLDLNEDVPEFLEKGSGGFFKGRDPNVSLQTLSSKWILNTPVIYIGKAGKLGGSETLKSRLSTYIHFGENKAVAHWGGRYIWQLPFSPDLLICWKITPETEPREVERNLIQAFKDEFGHKPFANLVN